MAKKDFKPKVSGVLCNIWGAFICFESSINIILFLGGMLTREIILASRTPAEKQVNSNPHWLAFTSIMHREKNRIKKLIDDENSGQGELSLFILKEPITGKINQSYLY